VSKLSRREILSLPLASTSEHPCYCSRLMIWFESILFHVREVITLVCKCAGAVLKQGSFSYVVDSGKLGSAAHYGNSKMISTMIEYRTDKNRFTGFTDDD
jgi:hypothetical protein